jgi:GWxTD domain-containing protein
MPRAAIASRVSFGSNVQKVLFEGPGTAGALFFSGNKMSFIKPLAVALLILLPASSGVFAAPAPDDEDWSRSPEAYFLTIEEKGEWDRLRSRESRLDFIGRYWLKRDPSPATPANEFQDLVRARIRTADARYPLGEKAGSRSRQGFVFIVFGTPSRVSQAHQAPNAAPRRLELGDRPTAVGLVEGNETTHTWTYDRERTPKLLEALSIPTLTVNIVVEPSRNKDELQNPGLINEYRERLARSTIVNPDLIAATAAPAMPAAAPPALRATLQPLTAAVRAVLEKAPPVGTLEDEKKPVFGSAVLWGTRETPQVVTWIFLPGRDTGGSKKLTFHALIRPEGGGVDVFTGSQPAEISKTLPVARPGRVVLSRFDLPPGNYSAAVGVTEGDEPVASATLPLRVPAPDGPLAASSLLVSAGVGSAKGTDEAFQFGPVEVLPRADAAFSPSESLWYFVQLSNVSATEKITQELRLRHGAATVAASPATPAKLETIAPGRYAFGYEIPLSGLEPGSYVLYVTVRDGEGHSVLRRGDFRVLSAAPRAPSS